MNISNLGGTRISKTQSNTLATIEDNRNSFERSASRSKASKDNLNEDFLTDIRAKFEDLLTRARASKDPQELEALEEESESLARLRAYVCPVAEIEFQGKALLATMAQWSVPEADLQGIKQYAGAHLTSTDEKLKRGALFTIMKECDEWSEYIDTYNREMFIVTIVLSIAIVVSLSIAFPLLSKGYAIAGLIFAGLAGASVSVISKIPGLVVSGDSAPYIRGAVRRVITGFSASVIGLGLLVSDLIQVTLPKGTSSELLSKIVNQTASVIEPLQLVAIVMLFGLSERAVTSFEESIFPIKK
jgi:hypothetical protein